MNYRATTMPIATEALPFAAPLAVAAMVASFARFSIVACILWLLFAYVLYFFRNPQRRIQVDPGAIVAPADGVIVAAGIVPSADFPDNRALRIAIFMSLFNCHMNWSPVSGRVASTDYIPGRFLNAMEDKSSEENERKVIRLVTPDGTALTLKLVAGLVARRIVSPIAAGDSLQAGEKVGLIRFGSRAELLLPAASDLRVSVGDRVRGGETVVANFASVSAAGHTAPPRVAAA